MIQYLVLIPIAGLLISFLPANKQERLIFGIALSTVGLQVLLTFAYALWWLTQGGQPVFHEGAVLYHAQHSAFSIDFFFDRNTMVYGTVTSAITFLVLIFSRYYIHREKGYQRFFNNVLFFYAGLNVILLAGNFETLFVGWEMIGVSSFFLIAFYRDRYLPVKNALKVVSLYRVADIALLLGIWLCHHVFARSLSFYDMVQMEGRHEEIIRQMAFQLVVPGIFLIAALVKSAQLPFSSWLSRAMEGPTTSSAIFYGSLSVHMGVFLLLRTWPFWGHNPVFQGIVIAFGLSTALIATSISRVHASVKTQLAYSSIAQIGLMFVEVALGWHLLSLIHFTGNAFLRTYQLLVSPSVLNYLIHDQFFNFIPPQYYHRGTFWDKLKLSVYVLALKEWNLDAFQYRFLWQPLKNLGRFFQFLPFKTVMVLFLSLYLAGLYLVYHQSIVPEAMARYLPEIFAGIGLVMVLKAFTERGSAKNAWWLVILTQLFVSLSVGFNEQFDFEQVHLFLSGIVLAAVTGWFCLRWLEQQGENIDLNQFQGHSFVHPRLAALFLVACLCLAGFPISPTFIGEDLLFSHIHENQYFLTGVMALVMILDGLVIFRLYARIFLGPHERGYHEVAYRSS
jgi:NADH:ubiquinone oxidoreductase subunit 5 (subunit L)/multisubunit Na+/H+ antiporter MnhA subunit